MKARVLKIAELEKDPELYPRMEVGWQTAYQYAQAMKIGDVFPPIMVGNFEGRLYVVDGWHRIRAKELLREEYIEGIVKAYGSWQDMFLDAIKYNISHGRQLSTQEKVRLVHKLETMNFQLERITEIVKVPMDKIELFRARTIMGPNGKPIYLKGLVARTNPSMEIVSEVDMDKLSTRTIAELFKQLIELIKSGVLSLKEEDTIKPLAVELYGLLHERLGL